MNCTVICSPFFRFKKGGKYEGSYANGKKHGEGTFYYPDGSKYTGYWINDEKQGQGTYFYTNGDTYEGEWNQNMRHGQGTYTYAETGSKYKGSWMNGRMEGAGELIHADHRYTGLMQQDLPKGRGKYSFDFGCEQRGRYELIEVVQEPEDQFEGPGEQEEIVVLEPKWICEDLVHKE